MKWRVFHGSITALEHNHVFLQLPAPGLFWLISRRPPASSDLDAWKPGRDFKKLWRIAFITPATPRRLAGFTLRPDTACCLSWGENQFISGPRIAERTQSPRLIE